VTTTTTTTPSPPQRRGPTGPRWRSARDLSLALAGYLILAVVLWWHVWSSHPTSVTTCGCEDPSLFVWFLEGPAYALAHGHNLFYSTALFHPTGINLLSNTGVLALGVPLAPVTWLFGPVATLNVASTLGPALTALAMFWLLRRWVRWTPAAFLSGLVLGFGPFAVTNLAVAHLNTEVLVLVPLMVGCLDELLVRQDRRPAVVGTALGLLVVVQFFLSTEMLVIVAVCAAVGVVLVLGYGIVRHAHEVILRLRHALMGLSVAAAVSVVLLAYPVWFALRGPAHLAGLVWPNQPPGHGGIVLGDLWHLRFMSQSGLRFFAGYQGPALPQGEYLGVGLLVVMGAGLIVWWRDVRLWLFAGVGLVSVVLSLDVTTRVWVPWRILVRIPLVQNISVARFFAMVTLCAAVMLGVVVDRTHATVARWLRRRRVDHAHRRPGHWAGTAGAVGAGALALAVGALAVVPMATALATNIPLTTESVAVPSWFTAVAPHLPPGQVVLAYPPPVTGGEAMTWQAFDSLHFAMATGAGPQSIPARAGSERAGLDVITKDSEIFSSPASATAAHVDAVRRALAGWGVTLVVVPEPSALVPRYNRTSGTASALGLFTLAMGRPPQFDHDAWVWTEVQAPGPALAIDGADFARCTSGPLARPGSHQVVPDCVTAAAQTT
jgi:hypothetical protein